jgi:hypothetical protein
MRAPLGYFSLTDKAVTSGSVARNIALLEAGRKPKVGLFEAIARLQMFGFLDSGIKEIALD